MRVVHPRQCVNDSTEIAAILGVPQYTGCPGFARLAREREDTALVTPLCVCILRRRISPWHRPFTPNRQSTTHKKTENSSASDNQRTLRSGLFQRCRRDRDNLRIFADSLFLPRELAGLQQK